MPNRMTIVNANMLTWLQPNFFPSLLTIQAGTETRSPSGAIVHVWSDVPGMVAIPCRVAPAGGSELRTAEQILTQDAQLCVVPLELRNVTVKMRAVVDGEVFGIASVDYDGDNMPAGLPGGGRRSTRLTLEVIA